MKYKVLTQSNTYYEKKLENTLVQGIIIGFLIGVALMFFILLITPSEECNSLNEEGGVNGETYKKY